MTRISNNEAPLRNFEELGFSNIQDSTHLVFFQVPWLLFGGEQLHAAASKKLNFS